MLEGPNKLGIQKFSQMTLLIQGMIQNLQRTAQSRWGFLHRRHPSPFLHLLFLPLFLLPFVQQSLRPATSLTHWLIHMLSPSVRRTLHHTYFLLHFTNEGTDSEWWQNTSNYTASEWKILIMCFFPPKSRKLSLVPEDLGRIMGTSSLPMACPILEHKTCCSLTQGVTTQVNERQ